MQLRDEVVIEAPVEVVWRLTEDVESWPAITPTMRSVQRLDEGPLRVGSRARVQQPAQRPAVWTVTDLIPGELFAWETTVLGVRMLGTHALAPAGDGCRNTLTLDLSGRAAGLLGGLLGGRMKAAIATENQGFKRRAEELAR